MQYHVFQAAAARLGNSPIWIDELRGGIYRSVVPRVAGVALAPPDFVRSVNPISNLNQVEADNAKQIILAPTDFQIFLRT